MPLPKDLHVAGMTFYDENIKVMYSIVGDRDTPSLTVSVTLRPHPENEHDSLAIGVYWEDLQIGWVARTDHWYVHSMLDLLEMQAPHPGRDWYSLDKRWMPTGQLEAVATIWYDRAVGRAVALGYLETASIKPLYEWMVR